MIKDKIAIIEPISSIRYFVFGLTIMFQNPQLFGQSTSYGEVRAAVKDPQTFINKLIESGFSTEGQEIEGEDSFFISLDKQLGDSEYESIRYNVYTHSNPSDTQVVIWFWPEVKDLCDKLWREIKRNSTPFDKYYCDDDEYIERIDDDGVYYRYYYGNGEGSYFIQVSRSLDEC